MSTFQDFSSTSNQLTLLNDAFHETTDSIIYLNAVGTSSDTATCGKLMFTERVQLRDSSNSTALKVASFSTNFTFAITGHKFYYYNSYGWLHGDGFGFMFSPDISTVRVYLRVTMYMIDSLDRWI